MPFQGAPVPPAQPQPAPVPPVGAPQVPF
jgi:hypothetical protein